jgi:hypothetical protein
LLHQWPQSGIGLVRAHIHGVHLLLLQKIIKHHTPPKAAQIANCRKQKPPTRTRTCWMRPKSCLDLSNRAGVSLCEAIVMPKAVHCRPRLRTRTNSA